MKKLKNLKIEIPTFTPRHNEEASQTPNEDVEQVSLECHHSEETKSDSIPTKLKSFYSHRSFRQIILSVLSLMSITFAFIALFTGLIDSCEALGFVTSIIMLFAPSPLLCN